MLRLAIPSKGEMEEPTLAFLAAAGLRVDRLNTRQYTAAIASLPETAVLFQRAADITQKVDEGSVDLGIAGFDNVAESAREDGDVLVIDENLGYSRCELVLAVPDAWIDISSIGDIADLSMDFRARGRELRVATKYPRLVTRFFMERGIYHFTLVQSSGAMEAAPVIGYADFIADITSSGTTLRENHLKTLRHGVILRSQACLIGNRRALAAEPSKLAVTRSILELIEARRRADRHLTITANIRGASAEAIANLVLQSPVTAGLQGPTVARVFSRDPDHQNWFAVTVGVERAKALEAMDYLRSCGAANATAYPSVYVFESESVLYQQLCVNLGLNSRQPILAGAGRGAHAPH